MRFGSERLRGGRADRRGSASVWKCRRARLSTQPPAAPPADPGSGIDWLTAARFEPPPVRAAAGTVSPFVSRGRSGVLARTASGRGTARPALQLPIVLLAHEQGRLVVITMPNPDDLSPAEHPLQEFEPVPARLGRSGRDVGGPTRDVVAAIGFPPLRLHPRQDEAEVTGHPPTVLLERTEPGRLVAGEARSLVEEFLPPPYEGPPVLLELYRCTGGGTKEPHPAPCGSVVVLHAVSDFRLVSRPGRGAAAGARGRAATEPVVPRRRPPADPEDSRPWSEAV